MTVLMMLTVAIFAYKRGWGIGYAFRNERLLAASLGGRGRACRSASHLSSDGAGLSMNLAVGIALVVLLALDWYFDFSAVMALMTPIILIGGMTMGWFTPTEAAVAA